MSKHFTKRPSTGYTAVIVALLLASSQAFATQPGSTGEEPRPAALSNQTVQAQGNGCSRPAGPASSQASSKSSACQKRVYLDDFQKVHRPVSRPINTKMVWLGAKAKRPN